MLRGLAIIGVVVVHTSQLFDLPFNSLADYGQMGVQLFFVVSAYTLFRSYDHRRNETSRARKFFIRRFFRIAPLYYCGLAFYAAMRLATARFGVVEYTPINVAANVMFVHNLIPSAINDVVPGGWSIGCEMLFYLTVPVLFHRLAKAGASKLAWVAGLLLLGNLIIQALLSAYDPSYAILSRDFRYFNIINQAPVFVLGIMLLRLDAQKKENVAAPALCFLLFTALAYLTLRFKLLNEFFIFLVPTLSGISFVGLGLTILRLRVKWPNLLVEIGKNSYSIYIVHFFFASGVTSFARDRIGDGASPMLIFFGGVVLSLGGSLIVAKGMTSKIENAGITLGTRLTSNDRADLPKMAA